MLNYDTQNISFSNNDLKREIKIPNKITPELAELIGIIIGDGNIYTKDRFELTIVGHIKEDKEYHEEFILKLLKKLFNIDAKSEEKHFTSGTSRRIRIKSKAILNFLIKVVGLKSGKKQDIIIPKSIINSNEEIITSFLRGLADTDFYMKFKTRYKKKNYYPIIIGNFSDSLLVYQLKKLLERIGFHSHIENRKRYDKIAKKEYFSFAINIVGKENLKKWMEKIGFRNKRHLVRYKVWKTIGKCPPFTNIEKGETILSGEGESNSRKVALQATAVPLCHPRTKIARKHNF